MRQKGENRRNTYAMRTQTPTHTSCSYRVSGRLRSPAEGVCIVYLALLAVSTQRSSRLATAASPRANRTESRRRPEHSTLSMVCHRLSRRCSRLPGWLLGVWGACVCATCALIYKQFDARELKLRKPAPLGTRIASLDQGRNVCGEESAQVLLENWTTTATTRNRDKQTHTHIHMG